MTRSPPFLHLARAMLLVRLDWKGLWLGLGFRAGGGGVFCQMACPFSHERPRGVRICESSSLRRSRSESVAISESGAIMALEVSRHLCEATTIIKLRLPDRRGERQVDETWVFLRTVDVCLYGAASGGVNKLLGRCA